MPDTNRPFERAMALAALSGLKIALGPAFLLSARNRPGSRNWVMGAMGEMLLDKLGVFPSRSRLPLLIPHTLAGAWVARESMREDGVEDPWAAPAGAVVAAGVSTIVPMIRITASKGLGIPDVLLALAEDYLALKLGTQAMGMSMDQVTDIARESFEDVREQAMPMIEEARERVMPLIEEARDRVMPSHQSAGVGTGTPPVM